MILRSRLTASTATANKTYFRTEYNQPGKVGVVAGQVNLPDSTLHKDSLDVLPSSAGQGWESMRK